MLMVDILLLSNVENGQLQTVSLAGVVFMSGGFNISYKGE
jgi:hypothetical protein